MTWKVPLSDIDYGPEEIEAARAVLEERWLTSGPRVEEWMAIRIQAPVGR